MVHVIIINWRHDNLFTITHDSATVLFIFTPPVFFTLFSLISYVLQICSKYSGNRMNLSENVDTTENYEVIIPTVLCFAGTLKALKSYKIFVIITNF